MTASSNQRGRLRPQGVRTRNAIVKMARALLLEGGSLEFTLREIALRAGISISNLQYYFPTRLAVLRAVLEPVIEAYMRDLRRAVDEGTAPRDKLSVLMARALQDTKNVESSALWCHFVSLVAIDRDTAQLLDEWYATLSREIAVLVRAVNPAFTSAEGREIATLLIAMVDGLIVRTGTGKRQGKDPNALDAIFLATVGCLLDGHIGRS
ncbi:TetR/AcrR family transcriptional regulator [Massilia putida]|uniref:TetR/AcrR family transcriptional regulator n=1 Tax=Massilia putida TaxID=1141883 RepID=UPI000952C24D|nr:TetR/AcrR family transcriptional regulator [Massilia putida]